MEKVGGLIRLYSDLYADLDDARENGEFEHTADDTNTSPMFY